MKTKAWFPRINRIAGSLVVQSGREVVGIVPALARHGAHARLLFCWLIGGTFTGSLLGQTALVRHAPAFSGGAIDGSVQVMVGEDISFDGTAVSGDLLVPGTPAVRVNGAAAYAGMLDGQGGSAPSGYRITLNGNSSLRNVIGRTDAGSLPGVAAARPPAGTRSVALNSAHAAPGDFTTLRNLTLHGQAGQIAVPPGAYGEFTANGASGFVLGVAGAAQAAAYDFTRLTVAAGCRLELVGPVVVTVSDACSIGGAAGAVNHPEWLVLNIAGAGLTLSGGGVLDGYVAAPAGNVTLSGSARLTGGIAADRLALGGDAELRLLAPPNVPPTVSLRAPAESTTFTTPAVITLMADAADADGTIARVEFYEGSNKLGEATAAPFECVWSNAAPGTYALTAKAYDNGGASATSAERHVVVRIGFPYFTGFEAADGYTSGPLGAQVGWSVGGSAVVAETVGYLGTRAVMVGGAGAAGTASHEFPGAGQPVVFVDFFAKPVAGLTADSPIIADVDGAQVAFIRGSDGGEVFVLNGNGAGGGTWLPTGTKISLDSDNRPLGWLRFTMRADFTGKRWDLYVNGRLVSFDAGLSDNTVQALAHVALRGTGAGSLFDELYVGADNPLFTDADRDGMDDAWETQHGLNPLANDRNADPDGDGLTNIREYWLGTNPQNADSDGDGLPDGWEVAHGLSPTRPAMATDDTDGDGVPDLQEFAAGTNPTAADSDGDGIPDGWEIAHGLNPLDPADAAADPDGDGKSTLLEYQAATDPFDYFNGALPTLVSQIGANLRPGPNGRVSVRVLRGDGASLPNAPVVFSATSGGVQIAATPGGVPAAAIAVRSDAQAVASVYVVYPSPAAPLSSVGVAAQSGAQTCSLSISLAPPIVDVDGDGLDDAWEIQYLGTLSFGANDDPGLVGRTLAQSHFDALSPWPTPTVGSGLQVWYRADLGVATDGSGRVSRWADLSGHGVHGAQASATAQPLATAGAFNGKPAIHFDGSGTSLRSTTVVDLLKGSTDVTIVVVVRPAGSQVSYADILDYDHATWPYGGFVLQQNQGALNQYALGWRNLSNSAWDGLGFTVAVPSGAAQCLTMLKAGGTQSGFLNGQQKVAESIPAQPLVNAPRALVIGNFGAGGGRAFNGDIAEVLIYNRALSTAERQQVEAALLQRYLP